MLIMTVLPFALVGAILGHFALGVSFALFSYFGMVAAMGVSVNDNVVLIDRVNQIRGYFAVRRKESGQQQTEDEVKDFVASNGEVWEVVRIDRTLELHEKFIESAIAANFASGPLELRHSDQMRWEKSELRESAQGLEAAGFQVVRVKAYDGIVEASASRFRQIVLTSLTTVFALVPMLLENAAIVQFLKPMALALAGGVLICMPPTLFMTPSLYMIGVDIKRGVSGLFGFYGRLYGGRRKLAPAE
jgi:Cu/Ag efflux pump CusA